MRVLIDTEVLPEGWRWDPRTYRRGTEEFYTRTAECLAAMGDDVDVVYDGEDLVHDGVRYRSRPKYGYQEVVLSCNRPFGGGHPPINYGVPTVTWSNLYSQAVSGPAPDIVLSHYHRALARGGTVIGHGCDPERLTPGPKAPIAIYTSSPDRGLEFLRSIWGEVEKATGVRLVATDGTQSNDEVDAMYRAAKFWVHPGLGVELFCLSALKAQAAGCIPIVVPHMALDETVRFGIKTDLWSFRDAAIDAIRNPPTVPDNIRWPTWMEVTAQIREMLLRRLK